jgi:hypothetical protein
VVCQSHRQGEQRKTSRRTQRPQAGSGFEWGTAGAGNDKADNYWKSDRAPAALWRPRPDRDRPGRRSPVSSKRNSSRRRRSRPIALLAVLYAWLIRLGRFVALDGYLKLTLEDRPDGLLRTSRASAIGASSAFACAPTKDRSPLGSCPLRQALRSVATQYWGEPEYAVSLC